ncbi:MAG TPA: CdaR family protein [Vicinamibacterales bacterium]|jgi:YbbR domain-containing protein|nr:CdaR family protein [Vicinamibacterales bacterium]
MAYHPFRHLGLKMVAIALATLLWLSVAGEHVVERIMRVPLEFRNIPTELEVVGDPPATVDVRLRGSSGLLSRLEGSEVVAVIDLASARPGSRLFHIRTDEVRAPYGVEVAQVVPGTLAIELEKSASRTVPIVPPVEGEPAPGYVVGRITSDPATVEIRGPESRVRRLGEAITEPVTVAGTRERVRDVVTVGVADAALRLAQPQSATVVVEIAPAPVEREVDAVPIRWRNLGAGFRAHISPSTARVRVRGRKDALTGLRADTIDAFVDLAGLGPGRYNLRVQTDPSQNFGVSAVSPQVVDVAIK